MGFWRERFRSNPQAARATIEALQPLPAFMAARGKSSVDEPQIDHERAFAAAFPAPARALGYREATRSRRRIIDRS